MRRETRDEREAVDSSSTSTGAEQDEKTRKRVMRTRIERRVVDNSSTHVPRRRDDENTGQIKKRKKNTQ